jgi:hypothetical protein
MRRVIGLFLLAALFVGCSSPKSPKDFPAPLGTVVGYMHITGGPPRTDGKTPDQPLAGVVEVHPAGKAIIVSTATVDQTGRFRFGIPAGRYQIRGRPKNTGIMAMTSKPFTVEPGRAVSVDLVEYAT